jgi:hypothetical protein
MMRTKFWHQSRIDKAILSWSPNCARWKLGQFGLQTATFIVSMDLV